MIAKMSIGLLILVLFLSSCAQTNATTTPLLLFTPTPELVIANSPTPEPTTVTIVPTSSLEFEIVEALVLSGSEPAYKSFIRSGVNIKLLLSNLDPGWLPEDQLLPQNFCSPCVGWDNAGLEDEYQVVILHFYSWDLQPGNNLITINAHGFKKQVSIAWEPSARPTSSANLKNPLGVFEIVEAIALSKDDLTYKDLMRPGINVKVVIAKLDTGLLPEDQLRPQYFCITCVGWDNAGMQNGNQVVLLHFYSSSLSVGDNIIAIQAYGVMMEVAITYDPDIHLVR